MSTPQLIDCAFECVKCLVQKFKIDESHGLSHSVRVLDFASRIYLAERAREGNGFLEEQEPIIFVAAILHDMCDRKYMDDENDGLREIRAYMHDHSSGMDAQSMDVVQQIISTMSYSKVKLRRGGPGGGFPDLGVYQLAYHIVREADLLAAYDIDRCVVFGMMVDGKRFTEAVARADQLYEARVMTYLSDGLFVTESARQLAESMHAAGANRTNFFLGV